jgi:hypothetical protein
MLKNHALELCWIWDKYCSVDVAAWVQAVGSVFAIALTVGLYGHQIHTTRQDKKKDREQRRIQQIMNVRIFFNHLDRLLADAMNTSAERVGSKVRDLRLIAGKLEDACEWSRLISTDFFHEDELKRYLKIRDAAFELTNWIKRASDQELYASEEFVKNATAEVVGDFDYFAYIFTDPSFDDLRD